MVDSHSYHVISEYTIEAQIIERYHPVERVNLVRLQLTIDHATRLLGEFDESILIDLLSRVTCIIIAEFFI